MKMYLELFWSFFCIGGLTFGGGLSMLPMLKHELVEKRGWVDEETLLDCYAIGQCTPGIIAINTATFIGYKKKGVPGAISATLGMVMPSLLIITTIALFLQNFMEYEIVQHALAGLRGVVCALMTNTVINLAKKSLFLSQPITLVICGVVFVLAAFTGIPTIVLVVLSAITGILYGKLGNKEGKKA